MGTFFDTDLGASTMSKEKLDAIFSEKDGLIVAGETLCDNWGYYSATKISECFFSMPLNWKYRENEDIPSDQFIKNCLAEIRQALDYKNKVTYKVISFCEGL